MNNFVIYLAGAMTNVAFDEQLKWRSKVSDAFKTAYNSGMFSKKPVCFSPPYYYPIEQNFHLTEREAFEFDMNALRKSDLVIVNFSRLDSIGTAMELSVAKELKIPVVGWQSCEGTLHPWLNECTMRMCPSMKDAIDYVATYFLK